MVAGRRDRREASAVVRVVRSDQTERVRSYDSRGGIARVNAVHDPSKHVSRRSSMDDPSGRREIRPSLTHRVPVHSRPGADGALAVEHSDLNLFLAGVKGKAAQWSQPDCRSSRDANTRSPSSSM